MKSSAYYFHMKKKILEHFQICVSVLLIYRANQWTSFCIIGTSVMKELICAFKRCSLPLRTNARNKLPCHTKIAKFIEIRRKDNIIYQLLLDLRKRSTKSTRHPQAQVLLDHQELASVEYHINLRKYSQYSGPSIERLTIDKVFGTNCSFHVK